MIDIFVPGRLCIVGEHSDWASKYRKQNPSIEKGYAIVLPTNQGNKASVTQIDQNILRFRNPDNKIKEISLDDNSSSLVAKRSKYFCYVGGTLNVILQRYKDKINHGIEINNYFSDLPIKKGLSSSASICVLVAKSFNQLFNLNMTIDEEVEIAYLGELMTSSRCGRMDQCCAYNKPIMIEFDGDQIQVKDINIKTDFHFIIVDLKKTKNTKKILTKLNTGFPFPINKLDEEKQNFLGKFNKLLVEFSKKYFENNCHEVLGQLMTKHQDMFDKILCPYCEKELKEPKLHEIMKYEDIQDLMYGIKGVGSHGDGTAQILAKNKEAQDKIIELLENNFDVSCLELTLESN
jgi:galactokinase